MKNILNKFSEKFRNIIFQLEIDIFTRILKKYNIDFYFRDKYGIFSKRDYGDNFAHIFSTKNSCDAADLMNSIANKTFDVSIDVGANIGLVSCFLARRSRIVYAIEPDPFNLERCKVQLALNNITNVELVELAVSNYEGHAEFYLLESCGHHSLGPVKTSAPAGTINVKTTTLDTICMNNGIDYIDFLKVDVEGFELEVFIGAARMLKAKKIGLIAFEISKVPLTSLGKCGNDIFELLRRYEYNIYRLNGEKYYGNAADIMHEDFLARV